MGGSEKGAVVGAWIGLLILLGVSVFFFRQSGAPLRLSSGAPNPALYLMVPFLLLALGKAVWETMRLKKFGNPDLELNDGCGTLGGTVEGRIVLGSGVTETPEFTLKLACIRREKSGKNTHDVVLWSAQDKATLLPGGILPFSFSIPADQPATNNRDLFNQILWQLRVKAPFHGVGFDESYELPVYPAGTRLE